MTNKVNPELITMVGWNCRSLTQNKLLYTELLTETHNPDIFVITETWTDKEITWRRDYEWYQTTYSRYQGVWIMVKKNLTKKVYTNNEPYFIAIKVGNNQTYIIGAYFKRELRNEIWRSTHHFINRIRKTYVDANIILFCDLNPDKYFKLEEVENTLGLKASIENKTLITRRQKFNESINESWLDFCLSNRKIKETILLESFNSDHSPLKYIIEIGIGSKAKKNIIKKTININTSKVSKILNYKNWPDVQIKNKSLWVRRLTIRPSIRMNKEIRNEFSKKIKWEEKDLNLRNLWNESFKNYVKDLDLNLSNDKKKFYQITKSLLKFNKGKIVKGIKEGDQIILGSKMGKRVEKYFNNLFNVKIIKTKELKLKQEDKLNGEINLDREEGIRKLSSGKAWGLDGVPSEIFKFKNKNLNEKFKEKLNQTFTKYLIETRTPKYFMEAKLVLLSKDNSHYPPIEWTRPISILPAITKIFELSIMNNLIKAIDSKLFNRHQRGFVKGGKTTENIIDLLKFGQNCQKDLKSKAAIVFFDIKTAYDSVVRDILYSKMKQFKINDNIILTVKYMLDNFK